MIKRLNFSDKKQYLTRGFFRFISPLFGAHIWRGRSAVLTSVLGYWPAQMSFFMVLCVLPGLTRASVGELSFDRDKSMNPVPFHKHATVENITLRAREDGNSGKTVNRSAVLMRYPDARATIVICHGFMCDKYDVGFLRALFHPGAFNFLTFDFRAHGQDCLGQYCTFGKDEVCDVLAAVSAVKNHPALEGKPVYAYAFSMGAVSAIQAQAQSKKLFDAMILDCPFDSTEKIIKKGLEGVRMSLLGYSFDMPGKSLLEKYAFHPYVQSFVKYALRAFTHFDTHHIQTNFLPVTPLESISQVTIPCFFIHCKNDDKVPVEAVKNLYDRAGGGKRLWITSGRRHFDSIFYNPEKYSYRVQKFLAEVMNGSIAQKEGRVYEDDEMGEVS